MLEYFVIGASRAIAAFGGIVKSIWLLGLLPVLAVTTSATPVTWFFNNVTFNDGGTLTGSFSFDADAPTACSGGALLCGTFSNFNITTTAGSARTGASYTVVCGVGDASCNGVSPNSTEVLFLTSTSSNQTGLSALAIFFTGVGGVPPAGLSDAGGVFDIGNSSLSVGVVQEANCADATCSTPAPASRISVSGTVQAGVPEPSSMLLLSSALAGLTFLRIRLRRARR